MKSLRRLACTALLFCATLARARSAKEIIDAAGVKGGLVVHLGCGNGKLTAALRADSRYVVRGLDEDQEDVERAREHIRSLDLYGPVSVERFDGRALPYVDNLVNLVVSEDTDIPMEEIIRVLVPRGVAYMKKGRKWYKTVKPWPADIDEWTHFLHGPNNNPVADDAVVGPPKRMQWTAGPRWTRSHEITPSIMGAVSAGGRIFYVHDRGPIGVYDRRIPQTWSLVARDAFNGVLLWARELPGWHDSNVDWLRVRVDPNRRLIADADRVYAGLGRGRAVIACDAATGKVVREYSQVESASELVLHGHRLLAVIGSRPSGPGRRPGDRSKKAHAEGVVVVRADTGRFLWRTHGRVRPLTLAADGEAVYFCEARKVGTSRGPDGAARENHAVCVDLKTGEERWRTSVSGGGGRSRGGLLLVHDGVVLLGMDGGSMQALSATTGRLLWTHEGRLRGAFFTPAELFVADGLVWPSASGVGYDLRTGEVKRKVRTGSTKGHHHRCHIRKATTKYLLNSKRGVEFFSLRDEHPPYAHDWVRGTCRLGVIPCNGLLYMPPHSCFCYPGVQLTGFNALAPEARAAKRRERRPGDDRLEKGPAYDAPLPPTNGRGDDWPAYRHDNARSGASPTRVPLFREPSWKAELGGRITPPVAAAGKVFVAAVEEHQVVALAAARGARLWSFVAGGRVDSPPTFQGGRLVFGSRDGWVYCLRASDGALKWRFRAAPEDRSVVAYGRLESAWPVHGSVLVTNGLAYVAAGRSSFLDGGIYLYALEIATGKVRHRARLYDRTIIPGKDSGSRAKDMLQGALPDIMVSDGTHIYMSRAMLSDTLEVQPVRPSTPLGKRDTELHLSATSGFLDDTYFNRTFWMYARRWPGYALSTHGPKSGQLLVFDEGTTYSVKVYDQRRPKGQKRGPYRSGYFAPGSGYLLCADDNANEPRLSAEVPGAEGERPDHVRQAPPKWSRRYPIRVRAMVLADSTLFIAGPPDRAAGPDLIEALEGRKGGMLWALSTEDGEKLAELPLRAPPVFDGLIAAHGRLYMSTTAGTLLCLGETSALLERP